MTRCFVKHTRAREVNPLRVVFSKLLCWRGWNDGVCQLDADVPSSTRPELVLGVSESKSGARLETFGNPGHVCWPPRRLTFELSSPRLDASCGTSAAV